MFTILTSSLRRKTKGMTPSTCSEDLLALGESSNENSSSDDEESSENQKPESKRETSDDIQSTTAFFSAYGV